MPLSYPTPAFTLCGMEGERLPETLAHSLTECEANQGLPALLLALLQVYQPGANFIQVLTLNLELDPSMEMPMTWIIGSLFESIWQQRESGRVNMTKTRRELEAKCCILREGKSGALQNAFTLTQSAITLMFSVQG